MGNRIVYPWRACPAIVEMGKNLEILFENQTASPMDTVFLEGPFNRVVILNPEIQSGRFEYDSFTKMSVNNKIKITIPEGIPEELYDLVVKCGGEVSRSKKSVKVVKKFLNPYCFIHITDPHTSRQWVGTPEDGYAKELELLDKFIEVANIIHPEFIIVTGDIIHHYTRINADSIGWGGTLLTKWEELPTVEEKYRNYFEGSHGLSGVYGFNAPTFSLPGNHDFYGYNSDDYRNIASLWNRVMGKRVYGFAYSDTRVIAADDYLGDPVIDIPAHAPMSGLQGIALDSFLNVVGTGKLRIMAQHRYDRVDTSFLNSRQISLLLNGHSHIPHHEYVGTTPTLSIRPGVVCRSGEIDQWEKTLGFFRIFTIDGDSYSFSEPIRFCDNPVEAYNNIRPNLSLTFGNDNTGKSKSNEVVLVNDLSISLKDCNIRFIMAKGNYKVEGGAIYQSIETPLYTVLDVRLNVEAKSKKVVKVVIK